MRCLAKPREERFQSFEEVRAALLAAQEVVNAVHAGRDDVRTCRGCGYVTTHSHRACPICANSFELGCTSLSPLRADANRGSGRERAAGGVEPEMEAVAVLLETARQWRAKDDLQRAVNVLRQAMAIAPGHVEARRELDELVLELARRKPKGPTQGVQLADVPREHHPHRLHAGGAGAAAAAALAVQGRRVGAGVAGGLQWRGLRGRAPEPAGAAGRLVALQADRGELIWELDTPNEILLSPCVMGGNLLFVASHNWLMALDARTGRRLWDFTAASPITASPVAWQNMVYFGTENGTFYALHAQSGQRIWTFGAEMGIYSSPLIWENCVYFGSGDHRLYAVDQANGRLKWEFMSANEISGTPLFHRGRIYVGSTDYRLYCLDYSTGRRVWEFATGGPIVLTRSLAGHHLRRLARPQPLCRRRGQRRAQVAFHRRRLGELLARRQRPHRLLRLPRQQALWRRS